MTKNLVNQRKKINFDEEKVEDIINELEKYKELDAIIELDCFDSSDTYYILYKREETDIEYLERSKREQQNKKRAKEGKIQRLKLIEEGDLIEYERLKKKFS